MAETIRDKGRVATAMAETLREHGCIVMTEAEYATAVSEAVREERERCARIAESYSGRAFTRRQILKPQTIAAAIRKEPDHD